MTQPNSLVEYGARRVIVTITAIFCALLEIVDTTIVNVALNDMRGNLGATLTEVGWVITAYAIGNVIIVPMTVWLSQQFGRRNYYAASVIIFTVVHFYVATPQISGNWWYFVLYRDWVAVHYWSLPKPSLPKVILPKKETWPRRSTDLALSLVPHWDLHWVDTSLTISHGHIYFTSIFRLG